MTGLFLLLAVIFGVALAAALSGWISKRQQADVDRAIAAYKSKPGFRALTFILAPTLTQAQDLAEAAGHPKGWQYVVDYVSLLGYHGPHTLYVYNRYDIGHVRRVDAEATAESQGFRVYDVGGRNPRLSMLRGSYSNPPIDKRETKIDGRPVQNERPL